MRFNRVVRGEWQWGQSIDRMLERGFSSQLEYQTVSSLPKFEYSVLTVSPNQLKENLPSVEQLEIELNAAIAELGQSESGEEGDLTR